MEDFNGLLLVDKPAGWTSFDVVAKVRGQIRRQTGNKHIKVGHTGTLDPLATGLLVLTIGSYCRRAGEFTKLDKAYQAEITLGKISITDDEEGDKTVVSNQQPAKSTVEHVIRGFIGEQQQRPPAFSAIKVGGQRAYKLARQGNGVELEARAVTIKSISSIKYNYPKISLKTVVSSGTYIRALARDIGQRLETGAYLSQLRRLTVGGFDIRQAVTIDQLSDAALSSRLLRP